MLNRFKKKFRKKGTTLLFQLLRCCAGSSARAVFSKGTEWSHSHAHIIPDLHSLLLG